MKKCSCYLIAEILVALTLVLAVGFPIIALYTQLLYHERALSSEFHAARLSDLLHIHIKEQLLSHHLTLEQLDQEYHPSIEQLAEITLFSEEDLTTLQPQVHAKKRKYGVQLSITCTPLWERTYYLAYEKNDSPE